MSIKEHSLIEARIIASLTVFGPQTQKELSKRLYDREKHADVSSKLKRLCDNKFIEKVKDRSLENPAFVYSVSRDQLQRYLMHIGSY